MTGADVAGWAGAFTLVAAYAATSAGAIAPASRVYQAMNLGGSVGLGAVAYAHHSWPSLTLNAVWLLVAAAALRRPDPTNQRRNPWLFRQASPRSSTSR